MPAATAKTIHLPFSLLYKERVQINLFTPKGIFVVRIDDLIRRLAHSR